MEELRSLGIYEKTVVFVTGDHGQTATGWHPPFAQDAWPMPVVLAGPGIKADQRFPYSEQIDIVPTLCYLMGVKPPENADGRIMAEALLDPPPTVAPRRQDLKELSLVLAEADRRINQLRDQAKKERALQPVLAELERETWSASSNGTSSERCRSWFPITVRFSRRFRPPSAEWRRARRSDSVVGLFCVVFERIRQTSSRCDLSPVLGRRS